MAINSATDHGFNTDWTIRVQPGLQFRNISADGNCQMRVHSRHRDFGYWLCVFEDGPRKGAIWIRRDRDILADAYAA
jgi:hypothetical protein